MPRFVRILLMGGADITDAVAERLGVPLEEAEAVKQATGLALVPGPPSDAPPSRAVEATGSAFVEEVRGSLDYYPPSPAPRASAASSCPAAAPVWSASPSGSPARPACPSRPARPLSLLTLGKTGLTAEQLDYVEPMATVPVGLAMGVAS